MKETVTRFSIRQRVEHICVIVLFTALALTGLNQKFFEAGWAQWMISVMGGIAWVQWVHKYAGILFTVLILEHVGIGLFQITSGRARATIIPTRKDFHDAVVTLRYYLRLSDEQARFDRFDYRQKFEYWGLVLGSIIMIVTGFMLLFPVQTTRFLPGEFIPAAKIAHSNEGLLAFLVVITWHIYNAHFSPDVFPFDSSIFTGKTSRERMEKEHPIEYVRMSKEEERVPPADDGASASSSTGGGQQSEGGDVSPG